MLTGSDGTERPQAAVRAAVAELRRLLAVQPKLAAKPPNQEQEDGFGGSDPEHPHGQHPAYGEADVLAVMHDLLIEDAENLERRAAGARRTATVIARPWDDTTASATTNARSGTGSAMTAGQAIDVFEGAPATGLTLPTCWVTVEHHALGGAAAASCLHSRGRNAAPC